MRIGTPYTTAEAPPAGRPALAGAIAVAPPGVRLIAFAIDVALVFALGTLLAWYAPEALAALGDAGRVVGLCIAGAYFIAGDSAPLGGRTPGKRLARLRVQRLNGEYLAFGPATLRYLVWAVPYFGGGLAIDAGAATGWPASLALAAGAQALVIGGCANAFLLWGHRTDLRLLHDLAAGSIVVREASPRAPYTTSLPDWQRAVLAAIPAGVLLVHTGVVGLAGRPPTRSRELLAAQVALNELAGISRGTIEDASTAGDARPGKVTLTATLSSWPTASRDTATMLVQLLAGQYPPLRSATSVKVVLNEGFGTGIAPAWRRAEYTASPAAWLAARGAVRFAPRTEPPMTTSHPPGEPKPDRRADAALDAALAAALPMRAAVARYAAEHDDFPSPESAGTDPSLQPVATPGARIRLGTGGAIDIVLVGGELDGGTLSWVPKGHGRGLSWTCAQGNLPAGLIDADCGRPGAPPPPAAATPPSTPRTGRPAQ